MSVSFIVTNKRTGVTDVQCVATEGGWNRWWLVAAHELGAEFVPLMNGGAYTHIPPEHIPQLIVELIAVRSWMLAQGHEHFVSNIGNILRVFADTDPETHESSSG